MIHAFSPLRAEGQIFRCVLILDNFLWNCQFRNHCQQFLCRGVDQSTASFIGVQRSFTVWRMTLAVCEHRS